MKKAIALSIITFLSTGIINAQDKTSMNIKDLNSNIEKYVKKTYPDYKITEAFKYDLVYGMKIQKGDTMAVLIFDRNEKFKAKATEADKQKYALQTRTTMSLDDVPGDITKYIKKNSPGYKLTEAYSYEEVYSVKIMKAEANEMLLFDKDGKFVKKTGTAKPAAPAAPEVKTDSVPAMQEKAEPAKTDSVK
jgi:hypothetical protein